jgi:hypothetical protein
MSIRVVRWLLMGVVLAIVVAGARAQSQTSADQESMRRTAQAVIDQDAQVCDVARLHSVQTPALMIATIDMSGRRFCNQLAVIVLGNPASPSPASLVQYIDVSIMGKAASALRDLDGDGNDEIVVPRAISSYEGVRACVAVVPAVFSCSPKGCTEVGQNFPGFYRDELRWRRDQISAKDGVAEIDRPCRLMEAAKLERALGDDPRAGMDLADSWATAEDPALRRKSVDIFADIADETAASRLLSLASDPDPGVASYARAAQAVAHAKN